MYFLKYNNNPMFKLFFFSDLVFLFNFSVNTLLFNNLISTSSSFHKNFSIILKQHFSLQSKIFSANYQRKISAIKFFLHSNFSIQNTKLFQFIIFALLLPLFVTTKTRFDRIFIQKKNKIKSETLCCTCCAIVEIDR